MNQREQWNGPSGTSWSDLAEVLDESLRPLGEAALAALAPRAGEHVLDIGCGAGHTSRALAAMTAPNGRVTGVDISAPLLEIARARGGGPRFVLADAGTERIEGAPFDAAFSRFGVMFFDDPTAAFAHLREQLRAGGRLAFVCWRSFEENPWMWLPLDAVAPLLKEKPPPPDPAAPGPFAFANRTKVETVLLAAGFRDVALTPHDVRYRIGADPGQAATVALRIGMLGRLIREQGLAPEPFRRSLTEFMARHADGDGVRMPGAIWIVTARA